MLRGSTAAVSVKLSGWVIKMGENPVLKCWDDTNVGWVVQAPFLMSTTGCCPGM